MGSRFTHGLSEMVSKGLRVPRLIEGVDLTKLPLSPLEGFVVSRIDGQASLAVLRDLTNLDDEQVEGIVARFIDLGVAEWARESVSLPRATGRTATRTPTVITVPESIRPPAGARVNVPRPIRRPTPPTPAESPTRSGYRATRNVEERVDVPWHTTPGEPRASHTGTLRPPGELEELEEVESVSATPGWLDELEFADPSGAEGSVAQPADAFVDDGPVDETVQEPVDESIGGTEEPPRRPMLMVPPSGMAAEPLDAEPLDAEQVALGSELDPERLAEPEPQPVSELEAERLEPLSEPSESPVEPSAEPEADGLDLDPDRQRRIDDLYVMLDLLDHYQVLGVQRSAQRDEVRTAYFTLSKVFHPDTMFRKRLGPYKARMEAVFNRLTEAYEVLGKKRARQDYDRYLGLQDQTRAVEAALDGTPLLAEDPPQALVPSSRVASERPPTSEAESTQSQPAASEPTASEPTASEPTASEPTASEPTGSQPTRATGSRAPSDGRATMSEAARARARELMAKKLRNVGQPTARRSAPPPEPAPGPKPDRGEVLRSLTSSLKATASQTGGIDPVKRHVMNAKRAERDGDVAGAAREIRLAIALAPHRTELQREHTRLSAALAASLAGTYEERAVYEQRHGKWAAAALSWAKVFEGRPEDASAARSAAEALVEAKGDLHRAKELAQRAVELVPEDTGCLRALARVYIAAGLLLNARRVLQRASSLDPGDEMVETLLRQLDS